MELIEIRDLDGPNVFLLQPAIKVEMRLGSADAGRDAVGALRARLEPLGLSDDGVDGGRVALVDALVEAVVALHRRIGADEPEVTWAELETPGHIAIAYGWERRRFALRVGEILAALACGEVVDLEAATADLRDRLAEPAEAEDRPEWVRDAERSIPIIGVTGTNGKTTTTRLIAAILRGAGRRVGWSSSSGVYIDGNLVLEGDYTGPGGARRVLGEPGLDAAVLETARGGILLRGIAYESNDVGVFINVSDDHLGLHGVHTVEGLARVKATVVRVTRPEGYAILNADDPLVRAFADALRASPFLVSQDAANPAIAAHVAAGGHALFVRDGEIVFAHGGNERDLTSLDQVPITFGGSARHMVENALCAAAACLALGLDEAAVRAGLAAFRNAPDQNTGRLNVFRLAGVTVVVDFAHNPAGLAPLLAFAQTLRQERGRLIAIIGTAGDRTDDALRELGRLAAEAGDLVLIKETRKYLRGREAAEMNRLFVEGVEGVEGGTPWRIEPGEAEAIDAALAEAQPGDVIAMMCVEEYDSVVAALQERGATTA